MENSEQRWPLPRWVLWLMLPGIAAPVLVLGFILFTESAHDTDRCPFREVERRVLAPELAVVEQARNCIGNVEEHRYLLERGAETRLLGERRFDRADFAEDRYSWEATVSEEGEVQVVVRNRGRKDLLLREGTAEERAKRSSR
jgi:hypothetical protein